MTGLTRIKVYRLWLPVLLAGLAIAPWIMGAYSLLLLTQSIIFSLYAVSYNLLLGYAGLLSFGHAMFFGVGAFGVAILLKHVPGLHLFVAMGLAVGLTAVVGLAVGLLLLRVKGTPFALLTLAFNALFYAIGVKWSITGGDDGINMTLRPVDLGLFRLDLGAGANMYYFTVIVIGLAVAFCWYFTKTAMGQSVLLIRENEERMRFLGYDTRLARLILFVFTGTVAGLAGAFYAVSIPNVSLDVVSIDMTTQVLLMTFIGGTGSFAGPIVGAVFYTYVKNFLSNLTSNWPLIMGLLFIGMVLFVPGGLSGLPRMVRGWFSRRPAAET